MAHSRSPPRSRSRDRQKRSKPRSPSRSPASSRSRSRSRSPLRRGARSPGRHVSRSPPHNSSRQQQQQQPLRRGQRSPRRRHSSSRSPAHRHSSRSPAARRGASPPRRRESLPPQRRSYSSRSPQRHDSRQQHRSRSRDRGRRDSSRERRDSGRRPSSRDRVYDHDRERHWDHGRNTHDPSRWEQQQQQQQRYAGVPQLHAASRWDRPRDGAAGGIGGRDDGSRRQMAVAPLSDDPPVVGSIHKGVVHSVKAFGVFVAIEGYRKHVLVHHTQVSEQVMLTRGDEDDMKVKALEYAAPPGQQVWLKILEVSPEQHGPGFRVHGSMRVVDQETGQDMDPTGQLAAAKGPGGHERLSDDPPEVGTCHRGEVKRIEAYGVFVAIQGFRRYGLVHASQIANYLEFGPDDSEADRKKALTEVVELGQNVWVKVVEVTDVDNPRGPKIGCSMKLVDQSDGTDLDPQNLRYRPRGDAGHGPPSKAPIGASAGEVKGGTVDWGYLATRPDAFGSAGYDLLGDEPTDRPTGPSGPGRPQHHHQQLQQQQALPPVGRGRGAVMPAWMTGGPAAPGSMNHRDDMAGEAAAGAAANLTLEEALRIVQAAAGKKKHKDKHKKHKKHKKSSKSHKKGRKHSKDKRGHSSSSGSSSDSGSR